MRFRKWNFMFGHTLVIIISRLLLDVVINKLYFSCFIPWNIILHSNNCSGVTDEWMVFFLHGNSGFHLLALLSLKALESSKFIQQEIKEIGDDKLASLNFSLEVIRYFQLYTNGMYPRCKENGKYPLWLGSYSLARIIFIRGSMNFIG